MGEGEELSDGGLAWVLQDRISTISRCLVSINISIPLPIYRSWGLVRGSSMSDLFSSLVGPQ